MDFAPHCPEAGFSPVADITRREDRRFDIALAALFGLCLGVLLAAGLAITHPAPRCAAFLTPTER